MDLRTWLTRACDDAEARSLPDLKPLLETLAKSTQALRDADAVFLHPALPRPHGHDDDRR